MQHLGQLFTTSHTTGPWWFPWCRRLCSSSRRLASLGRRQETFSRCGNPAAAQSGALPAMRGLMSCPVTRSPPVVDGTWCTIRNSKLEHTAIARSHTGYIVSQCGTTALSGRFLLWATLLEMMWWVTCSLHADRMLRSQVIVIARSEIDIADSLFGCFIQAGAEICCSTVLLALGRLCTHMAHLPLSPCTCTQSGHVMT